MIKTIILFTVLSFITSCKKTGDASEANALKEGSADYSKEKTRFSFRVPMGADWAAMPDVVGDRCNKFNAAKLTSKGYLLPVVPSLNAPPENCQHLAMLVSGEGAQLAVVPYQDSSVTLTNEQLLRQNTCAKSVENLTAAYDENTRSYSFDLSSRDVEQCTYILMVNLFASKPHDNRNAFLRYVLFTGGAVLENSSTSNDLLAVVHFKNANEMLPDYGFPAADLRFSSPSNKLQSSAGVVLRDVDFMPESFQQTQREAIQKLLE